MSTALVHVPSVPKTRFRPDIQGLRALCMSQVLLYHAWSVGSPIGVDSFILISAYLLTSSFLRKAETGVSPSVLDRWGRIFKRLLPPLALVVLLTLGASFLFLPSNRWQEMVTQAFASLTYWENWRLVTVAADYYAADHGAQSPFQHLWSMSMQGQVFLIWPLLMGLCYLLAKKFHWNTRVVVAVAFGGLTVGFLSWLQLYGHLESGIYFDTRARIWEFAFGSMLAALAPWLRLPKVMARALTWVGLLTLVTFCLVSIGSYPGPMALVPMLCVSMIILYSNPDDSFSPGRLLSVRPAVWLGNQSYAVYLVHWPIFVFFLVLTGNQSLDIMSGIILIVVSVLLGFLVTRFVDDPMRKWPWSNASVRNKWLVIVVTLVIALVPIGSAQAYLAQQRVLDASAAEQGGAAHPGAIALFSGETPTSEVPPIPSAFELDSEWVGIDGACNDLYDDFFPEKVRGHRCGSYGDAEDELEIIAVGSSHVGQNVAPALDAYVERYGGYVEVVGSDGCPWTTYEGSWSWCADRNRVILDYVLAMRPQAVALIVTQAVDDSPEETMVPQVDQLITTLTSQGIEVYGFRDNIRSEEDLFELSVECYEEGETASGCLLPRADFMAPNDPAEQLNSIPGFHRIEQTDLLCDDVFCPTIIGNVHVYRDDNHVSESYSTTMAPIIAARIRDAQQRG